MSFLGSNAKCAINMAKFSGGTDPAALWSDPKTGTTLKIGTFPNSGLREFSTLEGWEDAFLLLESPARGQEAL
jgi:hypothetical protein